MLRDRLRGLWTRLRPPPGPSGPTTWAAEPTSGLGQVDLPGGARLERSAILPVADVARALARPGRITLQHHWATWAPGVEADVPILLELHLAWAQFVDFFGVGWEMMSGGANVTEAGLEVDEFHRAYGLTWRTLIVKGPRNQLREVTGLHSEILPQTWIRDERGQVVFVQEGALEEGRSLEEMERVVRALTGVQDRPRLPG